MNNILVADIYGQTDGLINLAKEINADCIVDPYNGKYMNFVNEAQAYQYFIKNVGFDKYQKTLLSIIETCKGECVMNGFSVGAVIIWILSGTMPLHLARKVKFATCYYGSQIRHYTELFPKFPIRCVFPKNETHFNVFSLHNNVAKKDNVTSMQVDYLHGFMNTHSCNFNDDGYQYHLRLLKQQSNSWCQNEK